MISRRTNYITTSLRPWALGALALALTVLWTPTSTRAADPAPAAAQADSKAAAKFQDIAQFSNGDQLHGRLLSFSLNAPLAWHYAHNDQMIRFPVEAINSVILQSDPPSHPIPDTEKTAVVLTNNDVVLGKVVSMDDRILTLVQEYAPPLAIHRNMVRSIHIGIVASGVLYTGPHPDEKNWQPFGNQRGWTLSGPQLVSQSSSAVTINPIPLGTDLRLRFRIAWTDAPLFWVGLGTDPTAQRPQPQWAMVVRTSVIQFRENLVQRDGNQAGRDNIFHTDMLSTKTHATFEINIDSAARRITILIDGTEVGSCPLTAPLEADSAGLIFGDSTSGRLTVDNIRLLTLGRPPSLADENQQATDVSILLNRDMLVGPVTSIHDEKVTIQAPAGELTFPANRIRSILLDPSRHNTARHQAGDVRAWMDSIASLTLVLEKIDDSGITATSDNFGRVTFSRNAFNRILFHVHKPQ